MSRHLRVATIAKAVFAASLLGGLPSCSHKEQRWESEVEIQRVDAVSRSRDGKPEALDVELLWTACAQREVIRGDAAFAACMAKRKPGDKVRVKVRQAWDPAGFYDWDITEVDGCARPPEDGDEASFDSVQECKPIGQHGVVSGFSCNRIPTGDLVAKCPWFRRH